MAGFSNRGRNVCVVFLFLLLSACKENERSTNIKYESSNLFSGYRDSLGGQYFDRSIQLQPYVDSINSIDFSSDTLHIPYFIFDECFDLQPTLWEDLHSPVSLRLYIIERISSISQIEKLVVGLKNKEHFNPCKTDYRIPFREKSFTDLLKLEIEKYKRRN